jgi:hypothetical protein
MRSHSLWVVLSAAFIVVGAPGQDKGAKDGPGPRPDANAVEVRFADDSIVKMVLQHSAIEVATRYGKLTVPVGEIRRIDFGRRVPEDLAKRIDAAIARLGSPEFQQRDAASAELLGLRELAYPALQRAAHSADLEVARRARDALKTLAETVPAERLHVPRHDTIVTLDFTIVGQVEVPVLKARTPYFGDTSLNLAEVRSMRWLANDREIKLAVDAARYGGQQEAWMDSGIEVRMGTGLQIMAAGTVDLRPLPGEAGTYLVSPDGQSQRPPRGGGGFPDRGGFPGGGRGMGRAAGGTPSPGALVGRIGEHGRIFVVGSRYEGAVAEEGKLYLRIMPSSFGNDSSGSYDVRVTTGRGSVAP